jgi:hypothetical protein
MLQLIPVAAKSQAWVCSRLLARIVGSNPAIGMDVCLLRVLCVVRERPLLRADHSYRGGLPSVVCPICVIANPLRRGYDPESGRSATEKK